MSRKQYLLVDGHSVIYQWPELRALHQRQPNKCREVLVRLLGDLHDTSDWLVTLVFDGKTGPAEPVKPGKMALIYSQEGQTADSIIERLVGQVADRSLVYVVTADGAERVTVESLGAIVLSPDWLKDELERVNHDWRGTLDRVHKQAKW
ncbi:MAG: NYN domain-containing protein [Verrucomicrobiales bacterium]|jgi:predicted RNA-binding protein with PIN domain|nr:NYN domain-containing protein [Verrucomicrobiales bacterium]